MKQAAAVAETGARVVTISQIVNAPPDLAFKAWLEPRHLVHWFRAAEGWRTPFAEIDPRKGGIFRIGFASPDGKNDFVFGGTYDEVAAPERLVFTIGDGRPVSVSFAEDAGKTRIELDLTLEDVNGEAQQRAGWSAMLANLATHLANPAPALVERTVVITRLFDAPRELVFKAWTDPVMVAKWWGPKGFTNPVCEVDARPGRALRIVMRGPGGTDFPMRGIFREVVPPERLVFTNIAVDENDNPILEGLTTVTFTERDGKTELTIHTTAVAQIEEASVKLAGMDAGWNQSIDKLEVLLAKP